MSEIDMQPLDPVCRFCGEYSCGGTCPDAIDARDHTARNKANGCTCNSNCDVHALMCGIQRPNFVTPYQDTGAPLHDLVHRKPTQKDYENERSTDAN